MKIQVTKEYMIKALELRSLMNRWCDSCAIAKADNEINTVTPYHMIYKNVMYKNLYDVRFFIAQYDNLVSSYLCNKITKEKFIDSLPEPFVLDFNTNGSVNLIRE